MAENVISQELDPKSKEILTGFYEGCRFRGPSCDTSYLIATSYKEDANRVRNMVIRSDDVWVTGFPRSGTTLTQELVWQVANDCSFETASETPLMERYMFLEGRHITSVCANILNSEDADPIYPYEAISNAPSPRFIKSHLAFSLLPAGLLDTCKVVYVARDPRDVAVSYYQLYRLLLKYGGDFKSFWNLVVNDLVMFSPMLVHVKEAWALRHHPNMMFIFYEDLLKDLPSSIKGIADFFGKKITDDQVTNLREHLDIKNFRKNQSVNPAWMVKSGNPDAEGFVRKGKSGGWREQFDEEMSAQAQRWISENLNDSDLRFPDYTS